MAKKKRSRHQRSTASGGAKAGFRAFNEGPKGNREVDFIKLRLMLAEGHPWDDEMVEAILPR